MTIAKTLKETIKFATEKFPDKYVYIYGYEEYQNPVQEKYIDALAALYPATFTPSYIASCKADIGKRAIDCSSLVCIVLGISDMNSTNIMSLPKTAPEYFYYIDKPEAGCICWKPGHCGINMTDTTTLEARSRNSGVHIYATSSQAWQKFIMPKYLPEKNEYSRSGWICEDDGRWWYARSKNVGDYPKDCIEVIDGKSYMFDANGYVVKTLVIATDDSGAIDTKIYEHYKK